MSYQSMIPGRALEVENRGAVPVDEINGRYSFHVAQETIEITSDKVAELILTDFGDTDLIIFDEDMKRFSIDADGKVTASSRAT